jgi:cytochrome P450
MYREEEAVMGPIRVFARLACQNAKSGSPLELLSKRASHNKNTSNIDGVSKDMLDEAITLLFAGQDTSAATLSWTLHLLSLDPAKQQRVVDEVRSVLDSDDNPAVDFVSKTMIAQMSYLDAVIKESMRLYPVAPFVVRKLTADITIPGEEASDTTIPESTFACVWIYALHRNPKLWHLPEEFLPERWLDPKLRERDAGQNEPGAYIPFAMGPRNCLGRPLAQVILRVLLARILNRYSVIDPRYEALSQGQKHIDSDIDIKKCLRKDMQAGFTVLPSNGLMLRFVERTQ